MYLKIDVNYHLHKTLNVCETIYGEPIFTGINNETHLTAFVNKYLMDMFYDIRSFDIDGVILCQDSHSWRKSISTEYKSSRIKIRDFDYIYRVIGDVHTMLVDRFKFNHLQSDGLEADDLIMMCTKVLKEGVIITGDKDILQLATKNHRVFYKPTKTVIDDHGTIPFEKVIFGDKSDEISGVYENITRYRKKIMDSFEYSNCTSEELLNIIKTDIDSICNVICKYLKDVDVDLLKENIKHNAKMVLLIPELLPQNLLENLGDFKNDLTKFAEFFKPTKETINFITSRIE